MEYDFQTQYDHLHQRWLEAKDTAEGLDLLAEMKALVENHPEVKTSGKVDFH